MIHRLRPTRRPLAVLVSALGVLTLLAGTAAASPDDTTDVDQPTPVVPGDAGPEISFEPGAEIVHSWALTPAGSENSSDGGNRPEFSYVANPGDVIDDAVTLYNLSNVPLVFRVYAADAFNNADGAFDLRAGSETPVDVASWVTLGAENITVPARQQVTIPMTITVPDNARPGDHVGGVLASSAAISTGEDNETITLDRRTGSRIYLRVNGPLVSELGITDLSTDYSPTLNPFGGTATVTYTIENRGNVRVAGESVVSVSGPFGLGEQRVGPVPFDELLPGQRFTVIEEFTGVPALVVSNATVTLTPIADGAAGEAFGQSTRAFAPPILLFVGFFVFLFALLGIRAFRRHRAAADVSTMEVVAADPADLDDQVLEHQHS